MKSNLVVGSIFLALAAAIWCLMTGWLFHSVALTVGLFLTILVMALTVVGLCFLFEEDGRSHSGADHER